MKKILFCTIGALLIMSCSSEDSSEVIIDLNAPILPTSRLADMKPSRAIVNAGSAFDASLFRVDATSNTYPSDYTGVTALLAAVAADGSLTITPDQYYQLNGDDTALLGVYPAVGSGGTWTASSSTVSYTVDGKTDVMATVFASGNKDSAQPSLVFSHLLTQVHVSIYAADQTTIDLWGDVQSISIVDREPMCTLTLPAPGQAATAVNAAFSGTATNLLLTNADGTSASTLAVTAVTKDNAQPFGYCMFAPTTSALTLKVVTSKGATNTVKLSSTTFEKGKAYEVAIKMVPSGFIADDGVTIIEWEQGSVTGPIHTEMV